MSVLRQVGARLASLEARLVDRPEEAEEVRLIRRLLEARETPWIGTVEAQRLLGVKSINTVKAWARLGLLRSRREPNGRLKVHVDDVLAQRQIREDLSAIGSIERPLTESERQELRQPPASAVQVVVNSVLASTAECKASNIQPGDR
jgi:hypothetical protein